MTNKPMEELAQLLDNYYKARSISPGDQRTVAGGVTEMVQAEIALEALLVRENARGYKAGKKYAIDELVNLGVLKRQESDHLPEASTSHHGSGGSKAPLPTWTKAIEEALKHRDTPNYWGLTRPESPLASIQAATASLLEELVKGATDPDFQTLDAKRLADDLIELVADLRAEGGGDNE